MEMRRTILVVSVAALAACSTTVERRTGETMSGVTGMVDLPGMRLDQTLPQTPRPRPYPVIETDAFARAVARGTRTRTGKPGANYWTQYARYTLSATLNPENRTLTARGTVAYQNRSPSVLRRVAFHVHPNLFAPNAVRNRFVPVTGGAEIRRVTAQDQQMRSVPVNDTVSTGYSVGGTIMWVTPPAPVAPGATANFEFEWSYTIPPDGAPRGGTDGDVFFVSYWYPQVAVYDDVNGWQVDQYMSNAEFYMGFADYDVSLSLPEGWLVAATGELRNESEVLSEQTRTRLEQARSSRATVRVVEAADRGAGIATARGADGRLTWRYTATNVRDFAWGTSANYLWDAASAVAGDVNGDGTLEATLVHSFYRPDKVAWAWDRSARYVQHSIDFLSAYLWPYPYSHMTAMDGPVSCSGMEYPMMTCIGGQRDTLSLYSVTVHETAHMWFPMMVASDEKRHSWQDEGFTRFNQAQAMSLFFDGYDLGSIARDRYLAFARTGGEVELMRHGDQYPIGTAAFNVASYDKKATILSMLRAILGTELFTEAYREYGRRWVNKHPTPYDLWNTFNEVTGADLSWFWRTWYYETWVLDQAIAGVAQNGSALEITVEDRGLAPMPVLVAVTYEDGSVEKKEVSVEPWLTGARKIIVQMTVRAPVTRVELDVDRLFADIDRSNQVWVRR